MADAFDQAWGVVKADLERQTNWQKLLPDFDEPRAEMARTAEAEMPNVDDDEDLNIDDNQGECCRNLSMKFEAIFSGTPYDNSEGFQLLSSKPNAMYVDWNWWDEPCDDAIAIFNSQIKPDLEAVIRDAYHDGGMDDDFAKLAEDMLEQALEAIQEYEACQRGGFEGVDFGGDFTASGDVFEDSWAVTKFQPGIKQAWERFESGDSMPSLIPGLSGTKSKRHYQKFLTDAFGRTGSEEMIEPNIGGGGGVVGIVDASGNYTFYANLTSAISAASSGDTIDILTNIEETSNTTVNCANGVNINFNGYTYTLNTSGTADSAGKVTVTADELNASHPLTFIDDTTPDGQAESLKASRVVTVNPAGSSITIGGLTITYTQGDGRETFGTVTFSGTDAGGQDRSVQLRME